MLSRYLISQIEGILKEKKKVIGTIMGENDIITEFLNKIDYGD